MTIEVHCPCGNLFEVPDSLTGGIANCTQCGRAVEVPGLRDPFWRVLQVGAALVWAGVSAAVFVSGGAAAGLATAVGTALLFWLISRAL